MEDYNITIFRQSRVLLSLLLLPILILITIFIGIETSFIISLIFSLIFLVLLYYFIIGNLKITFIDKNELKFEWKKKLFFNYEPINSIKISDIKTIVLDNGELLRKIKTDTNIIFINNSKIKSQDAHKFINRLVTCVEKNHVKIIDSWDEFSERGFLRIAYVANSVLLAVSVIGVIISAIFKGCNPIFLSILLLFIPQMILYQKQMKTKRKK